MTVLLASALGVTACGDDDPAPTGQADISPPVRTTTTTTPTHGACDLAKVDAADGTVGFRGGAIETRTKNAPGIQANLRMNNISCATAEQFLLDFGESGYGPAPESLANLQNGRFKGWRCTGTLLTPGAATGSGIRGDTRWSCRKGRASIRFSFYPER